MPFSTGRGKLHQISKYVPNITQNISISTTYLVMFLTDLRIYVGILHEIRDSILKQKTYSGSHGTTVYSKADSASKNEAGN